jgi:serine kinase of HPr protein (carbohydrate metabolism regulator)
MTALSYETLHATCVAIDGRAVLIIGRSGSGKSDLALRLIDRGARLVSDDYTIVHRRADALIASAPATIRDRLEVFGIGITTMESVQDIPVAMLVHLNERVERMPDGQMTQQFAGIALPMVAVSAFEASAPIKVELALQSLCFNQGR